VDASALTAAAEDARMPLTVLDVPRQVASDVYRHALLLARPDQHVAWRGDAVPADPRALVDVLRGARRGTARGRLKRILLQVQMLTFSAPSAGVNGAGADEARRPGMPAPKRSAQHHPLRIDAGRLFILHKMYNHVLYMNTCIRMKYSAT